MHHITTPRIVSFTLFAIVLAVDTATAQDFTDRRDFRFIPSRSTLVVVGELSGSFLEETFHADGTFGLNSGYENGVTCASTSCPPPPMHIPFARFNDVDAWLIPNGLLTYVLPLDQRLNLTGLVGAFNPITPNDFYFNGSDGNGHPFHLDATLRGPLIHLVGESTPTCCNFPYLSFDAFAYLTPTADFNLDGVVDTADYLTWRTNASPVNPDGTDASEANAANYDLWRAHFGEVTDFSVFDNAASGLNIPAVPEPATLLLALAGMLAFTSRRCR